MTDIISFKPGSTPYTWHLLLNEQDISHMTRAFHIYVNADRKKPEVTLYLTPDHVQVPSELEAVVKAVPTSKDALLLDLQSKWEDVLAELETHPLTRERNPTILAIRIQIEQFVEDLRRIN